MLENEYKCLLKINQDPPFNKSGIHTETHCIILVCYHIPLLDIQCDRSVICGFRFDKHVNKRSVNICYHVFVAMLVLQGCTVIVTGMAGCAGMTLKQEPTPPKTALTIFLTLTQQVSSTTQELCSKGVLMIC